LVKVPVKTSGQDNKLNSTCNDEFTTSIPASGARSNPVQRKMPVNEFVIAVVLQKIHAVLH
jgi:hypothetical protein